MDSDLSDKIYIINIIKYTLDLIRACFGTQNDTFSHVICRIEIDYNRVKGSREVCLERFHTENI